MSKDKPHKKLDVWQVSIDLVVEVYKLAGELPDGEKYNLVSQMRRAAVSIPANIAEGAARNTKKEFVNYLHIAKGSLSELDTYLEIVRRLGYLPDARLLAVERLLERTDSMLSGLIRFERSSHVSRLTSHGARTKA
jgi:four helix bundle protein